LDILNFLHAVSNVKADPTSIFRLKDESLENLEYLSALDVLAREIADNLESTLEQFSGIYGNLKEE